MSRMSASNLLEGPGRDVAVEVAVEVDLVADEPDLAVFRVELGVSIQASGTWGFTLRSKNASMLSLSGTLSVSRSSGHPDVGRDTGVVEELRGQYDQRLEQIVLQDEAADLALPAAGVARSGSRTRASRGRPRRAAAQAACRIAISSPRSISPNPTKRSYYKAHVVPLSPRSPPGLGFACGKSHGLPSALGLSALGGLGDLAYVIIRRLGQRIPDRVDLLDDWVTGHPATPLPIPVTCICLAARSRQPDTALRFCHASSRSQCARPISLLPGRRFAATPLCSHARLRRRQRPYRATFRGALSNRAPASELRPPPTDQYFG